MQGPQVYQSVCICCGFNFSWQWFFQPTFCIFRCGYWQLFLSGLLYVLGNDYEFSGWCQKFLSPGCHYSFQGVFLWTYIIVRFQLFVLTAKNSRLSSPRRSQQTQSWRCWYSTNGKYEHFFFKQIFSKSALSSIIYPCTVVVFCLVNIL